MCVCSYIGSHFIQGGLDRATPLHIASERNLFEVARLLLKNGAKLDIKNRNDKVKVYQTTVPCLVYFSCVVQVPFEVASSNQMRRVLVEARPVHPLTVVKGREGTSSRASSDGLCLICMDHPINTLILPCGHQVSVIKFAYSKSHHSSASTGLLQGVRHSNHSVRVRQTSNQRSYIHLSLTLPVL